MKAPPSKFPRRNGGGFPSEVMQVADRGLEMWGHQTRHEERAENVTLFDCETGSAIPTVDINHFHKLNLHHQPTKTLQLKPNCNKNTSNDK